MYQKMIYNLVIQNKDYIKLFDYKRDECGMCLGGKVVYKKLQVIIKMVMQVF